MRTLFFLLFFAISTSSVLSAEGPTQQLSASDFRVTLQEEPNSDLPLGPSCGGAAAQTLTCRAFAVKLENLGAHTVHIEVEHCGKDAITIEKPCPECRYPRDVSSPRRDDACYESLPSFLRLRPGESVTRSFRLRGPYRGAYEFKSGAHTLLARWDLAGCVEQPEGTDCVGSAVLRRPVALRSEAITVQAPYLPDLGLPSLVLEVSAHSGKLPDGQIVDADCAAKSHPSIDCMIFHYHIRNAGLPVLLHFSRAPHPVLGSEYRRNGGPWIRVPMEYFQNFQRTAGSGPVYHRTIFPGKPLEGHFTLQMSPLREAGEYQIRFKLYVNGCITSPDASFCLQDVPDAPTVFSNEISLSLGSAAGHQSQVWTPEEHARR